MKVRKVGGLWHWRIGRFGGSFYRAKPKAQIWADVLTYVPSSDWTNDHPNRLQGIVLALLSGFLLGVWIFIGINSGFI